MEGFDTSTMTYMATPVTMPYDQTPDPYAKMLMPPLDPFDQHSNYDANTFAGSEDIYGLQPQATPSLKRFASTFDDPFSDVVSAFEQPISQETREGETTVDRDHKLLSFSMPSLDYVLLDYTYRQTSISLTAQLHGMFFLAESPWANHGDGNTPPAELTCYRRNLFQITGNVTLPRTLRYIMTNEGKQIPIVSQELVVTATESTEGNAVKVISVPWKTPANINPPSSDDKIEREPPTIPLDMSSIQEIDSDYASFPIQWKRLQFRIATANNGRRKELQQHFVLHLKVIATLATGGKVSIATARSGAIIVRGRSPRNFQSRKDTPLTGAGNHVRKSSNIPGGGHLNRVNSGDSGTVTSRQAKNEPTSAPIKTEAPPPPMSVTSFYDPNEFSMPAVPAGLFDNTFLPDPRQQSQQGAMTAIPPERLGFDTISPKEARGYPLSSPDLSRPMPAAAHAQSQPTPSTKAVPTKLSLLDDDTQKAFSASPDTNRHTPPSGRLSHAILPGTSRDPSSSYQNTSHPAKRHQTMPPPPTQRLPSSFSLNVVSSPDESADLLYEYFPLSLDDWMPPVDAVYRPHVVHHIRPLVSGPEGSAKAGAVGGFAGAGGIGGWGARSKRYFSEDVG